MPRLYYKTCSHCGKEFVTRSARTMLCSLECSINSKIGKKDENGCIGWNASKTDRGIPQITYAGTRRTITRQLLEMKLGKPLKSDELVINQCGTTGCCNPDHYRIRESR